ncbi:MAG: 16S rRNA (guanine(966)-N(2))-methyltransferase RsmD [Rhodothermales bacterium]|nr:16S rRNA (guanine(966)-N(2))-methyltransferase RsmD [Rhodothermales bacterium]
MRTGTPLRLAVYHADAARPPAALALRKIAGRLKRQPLKAPKGHLTRPTTDRTRESIFGLVESRIALAQADVLDLFAGTGALGLEAISRGADAVTFVEKNSRVLKVARENAEALGVKDHGWFLRGDAVSYLDRYSGPPYDLIFADPPYDLDGLERLPARALPHLKPGGLFVLEHDVRHDFSAHPALDTSRPYGRTTVSVFRRGEEGRVEGEEAA